MTNVAATADDSRFFRWFLVLLPVLAFISKGAADATMSIMGLTFVIWSIRRRDGQWLREPWVRCILALAAFAVLMSPLTPQPLKSLEQALIFLRWPLAGAALAFVVFNSAARLARFERAALYFLALVIADCIFQLAVGRDVLGYPYEVSRLTGPFGKVLVGAYSLKLFFFAFMSVLAVIPARTDRAMIGLTCGMLGFSLFLLLTGERVVFLLFGLFVAVWMLMLSITRPAFTRYSFMLAGLVVAAGGAILVLKPDLIALRVQPFIENIRHFSDSSYGRIFHSALVVWQDRPWTGVGMHMYSEACLSHGFPDHLAEGYRDFCGRHPHNIYLEKLAETGVIGLGLFLAFIAAIFAKLVDRRLWRQDPVRMVVVTSAVLLIFWPFASSMSFSANNNAPGIWLTLGWAMARVRLLSQQPGGMN